MTFLFLLIAAVQTAPAEPLAAQLRAAIWNDLELNGAIHNGNEVAWAWMNYWGSPSGEPPVLHILDLTCDGGRERQRCRFDLLRVGGPIIESGQEIPDRIRCHTILRWEPEDDRWKVPHLPPVDGVGHSRTLMRCEWVGAGPREVGR